MKTRYFVLLISAAFITFGCSGQSDESSESAMKEDPGSNMAQSGDPSNDVPYYPGSNVKMKTTTAGMSIVALEADASVDDVMSFYTKALNNKGWAIFTEAKTDEGAMLTGQKGSRSVSVTCAQDGYGKTTIALQYN